MVNEQEGERMQAKGEVAAVVCPSLSGWAFHIKAGFGGEARISQVRLCMIFQVCVSPLKADTLEKKSFLIDSQ